MHSEDWNPGKLFQVSGNYWQSCAIHAGVKLDIFTTIGDEALSSEAISQKTNNNKRGMSALLNALSSLGLIEKTGESYTNTAFSNTFLNASSKQYLGFIIKHHQNLVYSWSKLDEAVQTGKPIRSKVSHGGEEERENFLMGMFNLAMVIAPGLAKQTDLSHKKRLIDIGGGPGTYAIHFCLENPEMTASIFDMSSTGPFAEKTIKKFGLSDRINFIEGDYLSEDIPGTYDVAWLSHILHGEGPKDCQNIINKAVSALGPGGMIMIHEFILDNSMDSPLFPALFSLNMLAGTENGQSYSEKQLAEMIKNAGVKDIRRLDFKGPSESGIIIGMI